MNYLLKNSARIGVVFFLAAIILACSGDKPKGGQSEQQQTAIDKAGVMENDRDNDRRGQDDRSNRSRSGNSEERINKLIAEVELDGEDVEKATVILKEFYGKVQEMREASRGSEERGSIWEKMGGIRTDAENKLHAGLPAEKADAIIAGMSRGRGNRGNRKRNLEEMVERILKQVDLSETEKVNVGSVLRNYYQQSDEIRKLFRENSDRETIQAKRDELKKTIEKKLAEILPEEKAGQITKLLFRSRERRRPVRDQ